MPVIDRLSAIEILDSRGRPTVKATCVLNSGARATVSIPAGASTGAAEAHELRDGDNSRYGGLGCLAAVKNVAVVLNDSLQGRHFSAQQELDDTLCELDGTPDKSRLGANALLAVSLSFARALAAERRVPLYRHFADILAQDRAITWLPRPTINLFSGGKHAGGQVEIQDVLVVANGASTIDECLSMTYAVYQAAVAIGKEQYEARALVADEGGLAPAFQDVDTMISEAVEAIERAGMRPGVDVSLCIDVAASHFFTEGSYLLGGNQLDSTGMIAVIAGWIERYPIVSIEDGLAEEDWAHWPELRQRMAGRAATLGDDFLVTNPARIERAIATGAADALLLKVNQIGTVSEAAAACRLARSAGWQVVVSARSGETEDDWLTDLAVGWGGDALKVGSITRSERLAKWNRLLEIEAETGLLVTNWPE